MRGSRGGAWRGIEAAAEADVACYVDRQFLQNNFAASIPRHRLINENDKVTIVNNWVFAERLSFPKDRAVDLVIQGPR